ncbi:MAG: glycosyltransferase family 8 protein [Dysgonamonadaceae bacterium]|jgi:lipopolysaccharide biosynthesis glycosyltransferase|nr:glycosyltransferase family 8 protein [Dysgonamonadaceae bacterium]
MDIVLCTDNNYAQYCTVAIASVCRNNKGTHISFHIITDGLSEKNKRNIQKVISGYAQKIIFYSIDSTVLKNCPIHSTVRNCDTNIAVYFRLLIPLLLPETIEKVLYLDCDLVVRKNLSELWKIDIGNNPIGAVKEYDYFDGIIADTEMLKKLNFDPTKGYFNSGVLLMNLPYWREHDLSNKLINFIDTYSESIRYWDQDAINVVLSGNIKPLPPRFNVQTIFLDKNSPVNKTKGEEPAICHYTEYWKPDHPECCHAYKNEYYKYLLLTPWRKYWLILKCRQWIWAIKNTCNVIRKRMTTSG